LPRLLQKAAIPLQGEITGELKMYIYEKTGSKVYTVGCYSSNKKFITETVHGSREDAAERTHYLNGGINPDVFSNMMEDLYAVVANLNFMVEDLNKRLDRAAKPL